MLYRVRKRGWLGVGICHENVGQGLGWVGLDDAIRLLD